MCAMNPEEEIRALRQSGDLAGATTRTLRTYGAEVLGFLIGMMGGQSEAEDVFAQASHDLWVGMKSFRGEASMRTWFYTLVRHAAARHRRSPARRGGHNVPISEVSDLVDRIRTETARYMRSDVKDRFASIRDSLDADDQWLLVLRVDRNMSWNDIARVLEPENADASEAEIARAAARLRKRFQHVKELIRERADAAGLANDD
jgi:RNA polymerase sigma-70 factor (ECF subfamily)